MPNLSKVLAELEANVRNIRFERLVTICTAFFGEPRVTGSHHIFKMPWAGDPRINIQRDRHSGKAKAEQVRAVIEALKKLDTD